MSQVVIAQQGVVLRQNPMKIQGPRPSASRMGPILSKTTLQQKSSFHSLKTSAVSSSASMSSSKMGFTHSAAPVKSFKNMTQSSSLSGGSSYLSLFAQSSRLTSFMPPQNCLAPRAQASGDAQDRIRKVQDLIESSKKN